MSMSEIETGDVRVEFIADYILKTMKLRPEKWHRMYSSEDNKQTCLDFFDKVDRKILIFSVNASGVLTVSHQWASSQKTKCVFFLKKANEVIGKEPGWRKKFTFGDIGHSPVEQFSVFLEEVGKVSCSLFI